MRGTHVSIHDVMPETLERVEALLSLLEDHGHAGVTLLVVPGKAWTDVDVQRLHGWVARGHELAGHGWHHEVQRIEDLSHRLHSLVISRRAAEHLSRSPEELAQLVTDNHNWFEQHALPAPRLYVPPAWALGRLDPAVLRRVGFGYLETLSGFHDLETGAWRRAPVLGYEADTLLRQFALGLSNAWSGFHRLRRLAIHPHDLSLRLGAALRRRIARRDTSVRLDDLFARSDA